MSGELLDRWGGNKDLVSSQVVGINNCDCKNCHMHGGSVEVIRAPGIDVTLPKLLNVADMT